jgi:hypothetical protein
MSFDSISHWLSLGATLTVAGCAPNSAPKGWLPKPIQAQAVAFGGWIELTYNEAEVKRNTDGELIAVSADSVWVLTPNQGYVIHTGSVEKGKLTAYAAQTGGLTGWTTVGTLSTISNGAFLIFTAPMWLFAGSLTIGGEARSAERRHPPLTWVELAPFARFPQGLPAGIELTALQPKKDYAPAKRRP